MAASKECPQAPSLSFFPLSKLDFSLRPISHLGACSQAMLYSNVYLQLKFVPLQIGSFYDVLPQIAPAAISSNTTLTMEQVDQNFGFMLYRVKIPSSVPGPTANISIPGLADRAIVFVDKVCVNYCHLTCCNQK